MFAPRKPTSEAEFDRVLRFIQAIIEDENQRTELLAAKDELIQEWLDLFQLLAEYPTVSMSLRSSIFTLMIRLSRKSGQHPQCLAIRGVEKLGNYPVGGGAFGDVWQGRIGQQIVCLKVVRAFKLSDMKQILKDYMQEAIVWRQLNHPNVLPFMGIYYSDMEQKQLCLVSPWMERGNLVEFLKTSRDPIDRDLLAYDVACGLSYLHKMNIIHGDLKGVNILVTPDLRACIGDFGLSRVSATQLLLSETSRSRGTTRWLSPELLRPEPSCVPSRESDVYAYGCVCYEIFTGRVPFYELTETAVVFVVLMDKRYPSCPEDCAQLRNSMWDLMVACWNETPSIRPTLTDVLARILEINANRRLEPAPDWSDPTFTQIWNDVEVPPVVHTGESIPPRSAITDHTQLIQANNDAYERLSAQNPELPGILQKTGWFYTTEDGGHSVPYQPPVHPIRKTASETAGERAILSKSSSYIRSRKMVASSQSSALAQTKSWDSRGGTVTDDTRLLLCDDDYIHHVIIGEMIFNRYRTIRLVGQGFLGRVVEAYDTHMSRMVAIKIYQATPEHRNASNIEIGVLLKLKEKDPHNTHRCVHLLDWFEHHNHICLVSEMLGMSLFEFMRDNNFAPFPRHHIQSFARQLLGSVSFLHRESLIHTNLKPVNILLVRNDYRVVNVPVPGKRIAVKPKRILESTDIKLIGFGSATFEKDSEVVAIRRYRAPEIILGLGWSYPRDIYSLGCILLEFFIGSSLFSTRDDFHNLAMMEVLMGKMPDHFARAGAQSKPEFFTAKPSGSRQSMAVRPLAEIIPQTDIINRYFLDLVRQLLAFDPAERMTAAEALKHPYFSLNFPEEI